MQRKTVALFWENSKKKEKEKWYRNSVGLKNAVFLQGLLLKDKLFSIELHVN